jgi:two-component system response regulator RegX3
VHGRVAVVEDRHRPRLAALLADQGLAVETTSSGIDVVSKVIETTDPDLVVLEVSSVSRAIIRLCSLLQVVTRVPIAVFSELASEHDVIEAYTAGAQAVIAEPVGSYELVARVRALLRRAPTRTPMPSDTVVVGPVVLDRGRRQVTVNGTVVSMPRKEFDIAELLMCRAGSVVPRAQLVRELWGSARDTKTLDVQVGRLRAKLMAAEGRRRIITVRGLGYRFATDDDLEQDEASASVATLESTG